MNTMHTMIKLFLLLAISVTVLAASNAAFAEGKKWHNDKPKINLSADDLSNYILDIIYQVDNSAPGSKYHNGAAMFASAEYGDRLLNSIVVPEGATLTFNTLTILDEQKHVLPHCNMINNPAFIAGAKHIMISINKDGCRVN